MSARPPVADPPTSTVPARLDVPAVAFPVEPGGEIVVRGAYHSTHDGSIVDAATTTWPALAAPPQRA